MRILQGVAMAIPDIQNKIWTELIVGTKVIDFDFLAIKIFLATAQRLYQMNPESLEKSVENLHRLFEKNKLLPTVQNDIKKLFS